MNLFAAVSSEDMRTAQMITAMTMAAFLFVGLMPGLRAHAGTIRVALVVIYLLVALAFVVRVLLR